MNKIEYDRIQEGIDFFPENKRLLFFLCSLFIITLIFSIYEIIKNA